MYPAPLTAFSLPPGCDEGEMSRGARTHTAALHWRGDAELLLLSGVLIVSSTNGSSQLFYGNMLGLRFSSSPNCPAARSLINLRAPAHLFHGLLLNGFIIWGILNTDTAVLTDMSAKASWVCCHHLCSAFSRKYNRQSTIPPPPFLRPHHLWEEHAKGRIFWNAPRLYNLCLH